MLEGKKFILRPRCVRLFYSPKPRRKSRNLAQPNCPIAGVWNTPTWISRTCRGSFFNYVTCVHLGLIFKWRHGNHILTKNLHGCWLRDWKRAIKTYVPRFNSLSHMNGLILLIEHLNKQKKQCPWPQNNISCWHAKEVQAYEGCHTSDSYRYTHFTLQRMCSIPSLNTLLHSWRHNRVFVRDLRGAIAVFQK